MTHVVQARIGIGVTGSGILPMAYQIQYRHRYIRSSRPLYVQPSNASAGSGRPISSSIIFFGTGSVQEGAGPNASSAELKLGFFAIRTGVGRRQLTP